VLSGIAIKPHKTHYWCGKSKDPEFAEKSAAIIGLYLLPPENAIVLCVDEKSQIQALDHFLLLIKPCVRTTLVIAKIKYEVYNISNGKWY
jgi:hypothetical protein